MSDVKRPDGFEGQKIISLPDMVWKNAIRANPALSHLYITHIGYFPKAVFHYRDRPNGCADNILIYCLRGKGWYKILNRHFEVGPGEYLLLPATKKPLQYGADQADPWTIYWIHFSGANISTFNRSFRIHEYDGPLPIIFNEKGLQLWNVIYNSLEMGFSKDNLANANLCLYGFLATFLYPDKHGNEKKQSTRDIVHETILHMRRELHRKLTVEEMAQMHDFSVSYFSSLFRQATGISPLNYFIHLKLQKASQLLYGTDRKIRDIALDLGYDDPYYFSRLFSRFLGHSPLEHRKKNKPDYRRN